MSRNVHRRYEQMAGDILPISIDASEALSVYDTTLTSVTVTEVTSGLSVSSEATTTEGWSCNVSATEAGDYSFETQIDYANGKRKFLKFQIAVVDG